MVKGLERFFDSELVAGKAPETNGFIDPVKTGRLLREHFATVTPKKFEANARQFCPELFEDK